MKKPLIALCVVTTVVTSVTGCGCCRRLRDFVCRGARCGDSSVVAAPAPFLAGPPIAAAPMSFDPGCSYAGYDPGCSYGAEQVVGYQPYDPGCDAGSYNLPSGGYDASGGVLVNPGTSVDPGPASGSGSR